MRTSKSKHKKHLKFIKNEFSSEVTRRAWGLSQRKRDNVIKLGPIFSTSFSEHFLREEEHVKAKRAQDKTVDTIHAIGNTFNHKL